MAGTVNTQALLVDDLDCIRAAAWTPWGKKLARTILDEARSFGELAGDDLSDWPTADLVGRWAWDSRSDELERIGHNRDAFIVAMGSVRRSQRIRRELFPLATASVLFPDEDAIREAALRYCRAPLYFKRWQYPGYTLYYKEHSMPVDGDGEWGATENYLVTLTICAELLAEFLTDDERTLLRRRVAEFCSRIEDDFYTGRSWFFGGLEGGVPAGNQFTQIIGGFVFGALSLLGHDPRADRWVELGSTQLIRSMDATGRDGSYFEGAAYGLGTMEQVWMTAFLLDRKGESALIDHPQVRNFPYWLMDTFLPDRDHWIPVNDSGGSLTEESLFNRRRNWAGRVLAMAAARSGDANLAWCLETIVGGPSSDVFGLLCFDPAIAGEMPTAQRKSIRLAPSPEWLEAADRVDLQVPHGNAKSAAGCDRSIVHYPSQGIVITRTGFETDDVYVALKGGWSCRGHDHNDRNSLLVFDGPVPIITETGPGPYSDPEFDLHFGSHHAHSTVQVDGEIHPHGRAAVGVEGVYERVTVESDDKDSAVRMVGEAAGSYASLSVFERIVDVCLPGRIDLTDRIVPVDDDEHEISFWFHSNADADIEHETALLIPGNDQHMWRLSIIESSMRFQAKVLSGEGSESRTAFIAQDVCNRELVVKFRLERIA